MRGNYTVCLDESRFGHSPKKFLCPQCGKKTFVRYFNFEEMEYLDGKFGRCDREESCQYWMRPTGSIKKYSRFHRNYDKRPFLLPYRLVEDSMRNRTPNNFFQYLKSILSIDDYDFVKNEYCLGTTDQGETIFWQIDSNHNVRSGKIMNYGTDGHRTGSTDWVHARLKRHEKIDDHNLMQCFFGEHLLKYTSMDTPVAIVESEKTAVIAAALLKNTPFVWLAAGSKNGIGGKALNRLKCVPLVGRTVVLFPDLTSPDSNAEETCYQHWTRMAEMMKEWMGVEASVSGYLESVATDEMKRQQWDLADYLTLGKSGVVSSELIMNFIKNLSSGN